MSIEETNKFADNYSKLKCSYNDVREEIIELTKSYEKDMKVVGILGVRNYI